MKPKLKRIGYGIYIIAIALFFLYTLFPSEALTAYLAHQLSGGRPGLIVTIDKVKPVLPPGLKLRPVRYAHNGQPLFELSQMSVWPQILSWFKKGTVYTIEGRAYGGRLSGEIGPFDTESGKALGMDASLSAFQIGSIPVISRMVPQKIKGRLGGQLKIDNQGLLNAILSVAKASVQLRVPMFGLKALSFETIDAELTYDGNRLALKECVFRGAEMNGTLSGSIRLDARSGMATLDLKGTASPHHAFLAKIENSLPAKMLRGKDKIGFRLTGPIQNPAISFE